MKDIFAFEKVAEGRYRQRQGIFFDEFEVGDVIEHYPGRTITEADNVWMSLLCHNTHPLHIDHAYAATTEFGRPVVSSLVTLSIVGGMTTAGTSAKAIANLGWEDIRLTAPVFAGDTVYAETTIVAKRLSESRADTGIVTFETIGRKADGTHFMTFRRSALIPCSVESQETTSS